MIEKTQRTGTEGELEGVVGRELGVVVSRLLRLGAAGMRGLHLAEQDLEAEPLTVSCEAEGLRLTLVLMSTRRNGAGLSARECEIALLAASGKSNRAIAERLGLQLPTICAHLRSSYRKLGVHNRTELAARFLRPHESQES